jgi:hypothetical protein
LAENGEKLGFWAAVRSFLAPQDNLKNQSQLGKNGLKTHLKFDAVWFESDRRRLDYVYVGARTYRLSGHQFSAVGSRDGSETAKVTAENAEPAKDPFKARCCGQHSQFSCFVCQYFHHELGAKNIAYVCRIC